MKRLLFILVSILVSILSATAQPEKLSADDIIARHKASIGSPEAISASTSRVMAGKGKLVSKIGAGFILEGTSQLASTPNGVLLAMIFDNPVYPYEKIAFDGSNSSYGLPSGKPTLLVNYLRTENAILKDGLFAGVLSARWPLLDLKSAQKVKLETAGTEKIDGQLCYKLKYSSGKTGDMKVVLYFDAATFRHVRTEYAYTIEPSIGTSSTDTRSTSRVERYNMTEDFSDFKQAEKLTLPFTYKIRITNEGQIASATGTGMREWTFKVDGVYYNEVLKTDVFRLAS